MNTQNTAKVWRTLTIGTYKTPNEYRKALVSVDGFFGRCDHILEQVPCSQEEMDLNLVKCSPADMGIKNHVVFADIFARATELGLELCPAEVGPALCLQFADHRDGPYLIAMEGIPNSHGRPHFFSVQNVRGLALNTCDNDFCGPEDMVFIFVLRK